MLLNDSAIRDVLARKLREGLLPRVMPPPPNEGGSLGREVIFVGQGHGEPCSVCDEPIGPVETLSVEFRYPSGLALRFHSRCNELWLEERRKVVPF